MGRIVCWGLIVCAFAGVLQACSSGVKTTGPGSIFEAAASGDMEAIRRAMTGPRDQRFEVETPDDEGKTLMHHAAIGNQPDVIETLFEMYDAAVMPRDNAGRTPLSYARDLGNQQAAQMLQRLGARE